MKSLHVFFSSCSIGVLVAPALACFQPPPPPAPPPHVWTRLHAPGDLWVWIEIDGVFATDTTHACSCGVGLGNTNNPIPALVQVGDNMTVGVFNTATQTVVRTFNQFDALASDANSTAGWRNGPAVPDPVRVGAPVPGANWAGVGANVLAVDPGVLQANEIWILCINITWDPAQFNLPGVFPAQIGAGLGTDPNNFTPLFDGTNLHTSRYSPPFNIPGPFSAALLLAGVPFAARRRRQ